MNFPLTINIGYSRMWDFPPSLPKTVRRSSQLVKAAITSFWGNRWVFFTRILLSCNKNHALMVEVLVETTSIDFPFEETPTSNSWAEAHLFDSMYPLLYGPWMRVHHCFWTPDIQCKLGPRCRFIHILLNTRFLMRLFSAKFTVYRHPNMLCSAYSTELVLLLRFST